VSSGHEFEAQVAAAPGGLDRGLAREGIALFRALPASADREVLLTTDARAGNVFAAQRESFLLIDSKPHHGDPTF
jgi:streptomycin 6-kinase